MSLSPILRGSLGVVLAVVVAVGGCGGSSSDDDGGGGAEGGKAGNAGRGGTSSQGSGGEGASSDGASGERSTGGTGNGGTTSASGAGGEGDAQGGSDDPGIDFGEDDLETLEANESSLLELARMAARVELDDQADDAFAFIDEARAEAYPELPEAKLRSPGHVARGSSLGGGTPLYPTDVALGVGIGIATGQLLILTQGDASPEAFPITTTVHSESGGMSTDVTSVDSLMQNGSSRSAQISSRVALTLPDGTKLDETVMATGDVEHCPDDQGKVHINVSVVVGVTSETGAMQASYTGHATASVNDDAEVTGMEVAADVDAITEGSATDVANTGGELHVDLSFTGSNLDLSGDPRVTVTRDTRSEAVGNHIRALLRSMPGTLESFMLRNARQRWQSGQCVELVVMGADGSNTVEPGSVTGFSATLRHKLDGKELDGLPITSSLSGDKSISPSGKSSSPVSYGYTAPTMDDAMATVTLESRSRRGVAEAKEVHFDTAGVKRYAGPLRFTVVVEDSSSRTEWTGTINAEFVRESVSEGGALYTLDPVSSISWDTATTVNSVETCTLPASVNLSASSPNPAGVASANGNLAITTNEPRGYEFVVGASGLATDECEDDDGNKTMKPVPLIAYAYTTSGLEDTSLQPLDDPTLIVGSSTYELDMAGMTVETSWKLQPVPE